MDFDGCPERFLDRCPDFFKNIFVGGYPEKFVQNIFSRTFYGAATKVPRRLFSAGLDHSNLALVCVIEPSASVPKLSMDNNFPWIQSTFTSEVVLHSTGFDI